MKIPIALAAAVFAASALQQAYAAVVCEFEPTLALDDCRTCYKASPDGIRLFINGALRASSTSPLRPPTLPIDGKHFSRGVEKKMPDRPAGLDFFEVCYESVSPLKAASFELVMTDADIEEFEMDPPGKGSGYQYEVAGKVTSGSASFFGSTLAFMPPAAWSGRSEIPYRVVDRDGRESAPGVITVSAPVSSQITPLVITYRASVPDTQSEQQRQAKLEAEQQELIKAEIRTEIAILEGELDVESAGTLAMQAEIAQLETMIASMGHDLTARQREIERLMALDAVVSLEDVARDASSMAHVLAKLALNSTTSAIEVSEKPEAPDPYSQHAPIVFTLNRNGWGRVEDDAVEDQGERAEPEADWSEMEEGDADPALGLAGAVGTNQVLKKKRYKKKAKKRMYAGSVGVIRADVRLRVGA